MPIQVIMPQLGESVLEGTISKWLIAVGEQINEHDPLVEVNTDKVDTEIPSPASGILVKVLVEEGTIDAEDIKLFWYAENAQDIWNGILKWYKKHNKSLFPESDK